MSKILVEVSARHIHLTDKAVDILFGKGYKLRAKRPLSQKGQYLCEEKVSVIGLKGGFKTVSVLGPNRKSIQVEISKTDARKIGLDAPIRDSGDLKNSAGCTIIGPKGELKILEGVIVAKRHIHLSEDDAKNEGVKDGDLVCVAINSKDRAAIFKDVLIRVCCDYVAAMHIDTDEAGAINFSGEYGQIVNV